MDKLKFRNFKIEKPKWLPYFYLKITLQSIPEDDIVKLQYGKINLDC